MYEGRMVAKSVTLPEELIKFAQDYSPTGSLSAGIRIALLQLSEVDPDADPVPGSAKMLFKELGRE